MDNNNVLHKKADEIEFRQEKQELEGFANLDIATSLRVRDRERPEFDESKAQKLQRYLTLLDSGDITVEEMEKTRAKIEILIGRERDHRV